MMCLFCSERKRQGVPFCAIYHINVSIRDIESTIYVWEDTNVIYNIYFETFEYLVISKLWITF